MKKFRFADSVSLRLIQIFQEAILTGVDGADLLRQVRLCVDEDDDSLLVQDPEYVQQVKEGHDRLVAEARRLQGQRGFKLILGGDDDPSDSN